MSKHHKPKDPCDKKKSRCCIGCVECSPKNEGSNNAAIIQSLSQSAVCVLLCGADDPKSGFRMNLAADSDEAETEDFTETESKEVKTFADALITFIQDKLENKISKTDG